MKMQFKYLCALFIFLLFSSTSPHIQESDSIEDLLQEAKKYDPEKVLVACDIDQTLMMSTREFGGNPWFVHMVQQKMAQGMSNTEAIQLTLPEYFYAQFRINMQTVEPCTAQVIRQLKQDGYNVICLTARSAELLYRTHIQLEGIGIDSNNDNFKKYCFFNDLVWPCLYLNGILGVKDNHKGEALFRFLDINKTQFEAVIFIDDQEKYLKQVEGSAAKRDVEFVGLRYSKCDELSKNFNPDLADEEYETFIAQERLAARA